MARLPSLHLYGEELEAMRKLDPLLAIEHELQGLVNQCAYGLGNRRAKQRIKELAQQRDEMKRIER